MTVRVQKVQTIADRVKMNPREAARQANDAFKATQESTSAVQENCQKNLRVSFTKDGSRRVVEAKKQVVENVTHRYMLRSRC